ncbi:PLXNB [Mytilus coruscus]|uniref:PLXNB n=1 Tax=Mytilus coruscus TaxID=42192 RepID=A0A6J8CCR1_MYTCO|nr:PLXNB [Mytilus coruscus]
MDVTNQSVYIGGDGGIVALHQENLTEQALTTNYSNVWLLLYQNENKEIIQCYNDIINVSYCIKMTWDLHLLCEKSFNMSVDKTHPPTYSMITDIAVITTSYGFLSLNLTDMTHNVLHKLKREPNETVVFKSSFVYKASYFLFFQIFQKNGDYISSKIGKLCLNNNAIKAVSTHTSSYEDMELSCVYENKTFRTIEHGIIADGVFVVVFRENGTTLICVFGSSDIALGFHDSRKRFSVELSSHISEICNESAANVANMAYNCTEVHCTKSIYPVYAGKVVITSVDILIHDWYPVLYIGTEDGRIGKIRSYFIDNDLIKNADFQQFDTVKIIKIQTGQDHILALSSNKFQKITFVPCSSCRDCESCMETLNPNCGWDYDTQQCISNQSYVWSWIPSRVGFCANISHLNKQIRIENDTTHNEIKFRIKVPEKIATYCTKASCTVGTISGSIRRNFTSPNTCTISLYNLTAGHYNFSIQCEDGSKNVVIAVKDVDLLRCNDSLACTECTNLGCLWLSESFSCVRACRAVSSIVVEPNFTCEIRQKNSFSWTFEALWIQNTTYVRCLGVNLSETSAQYKIKLKYKTFYVDNYAPLRVYSCRELLYDNTNCGECQYWINKKFECQWCTSDLKCYNEELETCNEIHTIPNCIPSIKMVYPSSGPVNGGTLINITGQSIGNRDDDVIIVDIDGVKCNNVTVLIASNR